MHAEQHTLRVGMFGLGTVGTGVARILTAHKDDVARRAGVGIELAKVAVRDLNKPRDESVSRSILTTDPDEILNDPSIHIVVEVMGGEEPAKQYIERAINAGKHVVTANKLVLAKYGEELFDLSRRANSSIAFEASVAAGIPIVKSLLECLSANKVQQIMGIINGTTNYILSRMTEGAGTLDEALREAQNMGYAESDPSSDINGFDAAYKLAILASLAFETPVCFDDVYVEGIRKITPADIQYARELGYVVKLLAIAKDQSSSVEVRVHPTFVPRTHPLASVSDVFNAIFVKGDAVGELMFYGRGAGQMPTASAVVADIVDASYRVRGLGNGRFMRNGALKQIKPMADTLARYYVRLSVLDKPGVLASIAASFGDRQVSIESVIQKGRGHNPVDLVFVTHEVRERNIMEALSIIRKLPVVNDVCNVIRVEGESSSNLNNITGT